MDSLLATYVSSDEDEVELPRQQLHPKPAALSAASFFTSLPPPKSFSSSGSTRPPNSHNQQNPRIQASQSEDPDVLDDRFSGSGTLFGSLSLPTSHASQTLENQIPSRDRDDEGLFTDGVGERRGIFPALPAPKYGDVIPKASLNLPVPKKVVQFKPPVMGLARGDGNEDSDEEDEDEEGMERKRKRELQSSMEAPTVKSFLSSIPAPKNSKAALGVLPMSGSGRRSIIDADVPSLKQRHQQLQQLEEGSVAVNSNPVIDDCQGGYADGSCTTAAVADGSHWYQPGESYKDYGSGSSVGYENYAGHDSYGVGGVMNHGEYPQYESNWIDKSGSNSTMETPAVPEIMARVLGKRGRNEIPTDIIEVKQDELMKNRPREDQVKATGIAFGPSYQPVSTAKGKPSKLHKRKHQIGSLYFDMKQKEMELAERRSRGYLTKAETHAKYGW